MSDVRWKVRLSPTGEVRRVDDAGLADLLRDPKLRVWDVEAVVPVTEGS